MNSAKRVSNQTIKNNNKKDDVKKNDGVASKKGTVIISSCVAVLVLIIAMVCWEQLHPKLVLKVNGEKVYLKDIMYDIYVTESTGAYMDTLYQQNYGSSYWAIENEDGTTNAELLKDNTIEAVSQKYMLYNEAINNGYTLTEEETSAASTDATEAYDQLSADVKNKTGLTKDSLVKYYEMQTLADRYKQDWIDSFDIDDASLIADINKDDFRQYDIQYYYIPYTSTDANGEETTISDDEKAAFVSELEDSYKDIAGLEDFSTYISTETASSAEGAEATATPAPGPKAPEGTNIKYSTKSFIETDEDVFGEDLLDEIKAMDNDEITSGVVADDNGCYIIKMVNNNSSERYDSECETAITDEENRVYAEKIDELEVESYLIEINDKEWNKIKFGSVTIN